MPTQTPTPPPNHQQITWVYTNDLPASTHFYEDILTLELAVDEGTARVYRISPTSFVGICQAWGDRQVLPAGTCLTFVTNQVDAWYDYLVAKNVTMEGEPHELPQFGIYACFARDPSGYRVEFQQYLNVSL